MRMTSRAIRLEQTNPLPCLDPVDGRMRRTRPLRRRLEFCHRLLVARRVRPLRLVIVQHAHRYRLRLLCLRADLEWQWSFRRRLRHLERIRFPRLRAVRQPRMMMRGTEHSLGVDVIEVHRVAVDLGIREDLANREALKDLGFRVTQGIRDSLSRESLYRVVAQRIRHEIGTPLPLWLGRLLLRENRSRFRFQRRGGRRLTDTTGGLRVTEAEAPTTIARRSIVCIPNARQETRSLDGRTMRLRPRDRVLRLLDLQVAIRILQETMTPNPLTARIRTQAPNPTANPTRTARRRSCIRQKSIQSVKESS